MPESDRTALSMNVGSEFFLDLVINNQVVNELGLIEQTGRKVNATLLEMTPTNNFGYIVRRVTYQGFTMDLRVTRQDDTMDDLVDALVDAYHNHAPASLFSGVETVINNGTASQWRYSNGVFVPGSLGTAKGADKVDDVECQVHFSYRTKITGGSNAPSILSSAGL
jgi:hypothetical protein